MQVTSYNLHLGLLRSEPCWGEHRTVYSGRRQADVVMTSIRRWRALSAAPTVSHSRVKDQGTSLWSETLSSFDIVEYFYLSGKKTR
jgi:hypothetical protein